METDPFIFVKSYLFRRTGRNGGNANIISELEGVLLFPMRHLTYWLIFVNLYDAILGD